jgi:hypothetical protein
MIEARVCYHDNMKRWVGLLLVLFLVGCTKEVKTPMVENPKIDIGACFFWLV